MLGAPAFPETPRPLAAEAFLIGPWVSVGRGPALGASGCRHRVAPSGGPIRGPCSARGASGIPRFRGAPIAHELRVPPLRVRPDLLHAANVVLRGLVPVARVPSPDASPDVSRAIVVSQPVLLPLVAGAPDRVGVVDVERGALVRVGPRAPVGRGKVRTLHLEQPDAVTAIRVGHGPTTAVPQRRLDPVALPERLRPDDVLVDSPLARAPLDDLVGGAGEVSGDS